MKKSNYLKSTFNILMMLLISVTIFSCEKDPIFNEDNNNNNSGTGDSNGELTFYIITDFYCGNISVSINGSSRIISSYYSGGISGCNVSGCANYTLPAGTYHYTAKCQGYSWNGNTTITPEGCKRIKLIL